MKKFTNLLVFYIQKHRLIKNHIQIHIHYSRSNIFLSLYLAQENTLLRNNGPIICNPHVRFKKHYERRINAKKNPIKKSREASTQGHQRSGQLNRGIKNELMCATL